MDQLIIAAIGAGGKTTTMRTLARYFRDRSVLFTTTTHIFRLNQAECRLFLPDPQPEKLLEELALPGVICTGTMVKPGKLAALPEVLLTQAMDRAQVTLYEADGAKCLPLKLHRECEPVVLPQTDRCVVVAGLSALGAPIQDVVHCWQLDQDWSQHPNRPVDSEVFIRCIMDAVNTAHLPRERFRVLLNQADTLKHPKDAEHILEALRREGLNCRLGSLSQSPDFLPGWVLEA